MFTIKHYSFIWCEQLWIVQNISEPVVPLWETTLTKDRLFYKTGSAGHKCSMSHINSPLVRDYLFWEITWSLRVVSQKTYHCIHILVIISTWCMSPARLFQCKHMYSAVNVNTCYCTHTRCYNRPYMWHHIVHTCPQQYHLPWELLSKYSQTFL